jgi:hypothetical protein
MSQNIELPSVTQQSDAKTPSNNNPSSTSKCCSFWDWCPKVMTIGMDAFFGGGTGLAGWCWYLYCADPTDVAMLAAAIMTTVTFVPSFIASAIMTVKHGKVIFGCSTSKAESAAGSHDAEKGQGQGISINNSDKKPSVTAPLLGKGK